MSERRKRAAWPVIFAASMAAVIASGVVLYAWSYFALSQTTDVDFVGQGPMTFRYYDENWKARMYRPTASIESFFSGRKIVIVSDESDVDFQNFQP
jgi:hypothetical protein